MRMITAICCFVITIKIIYYPSPIFYFRYISFLYVSCCFGLNLILNQFPNLSNYSKYAAITPTTSMPTGTTEPLL